MASERKKLEGHLINLRLTSKQLQAESRKAGKKKVEEKRRCKRAIERGQDDVVRIHAENAIRAGNESMMCLRLASRVDAVASRVQAAVRMNQITRTLRGIVMIMDHVCKQQSVWSMAMTMDKFEGQFEELDIKMSLMSDSVDRTVVTSTPRTEVDTLILQVADEHQLNLTYYLGEAAPEAPRAEPSANAQDDSVAEASSSQPVDDNVPTADLLGLLECIEPSNVDPSAANRKK
jgi:charged multivesicular body protein 1